jgi:glycosyltransferase involved in cell wall biosynthesis
LDIEKLEVFSAEEKKYINAIVIPFPKSIKFPGHYIFNSYRYSKQIFESIKPHLQEYNFIYVQGFTGWKLINEKSKGKIKCAPIGVNFHGYEMFQPAPNFKIKLQYFLLRTPVLQNIQNADYVFSFGAKIKDIVAKFVSEEKIIIMHNGINASWIRQKNLEINKPIKFVFVGRYERRKGIEELNIVLKQILKENFVFEFIGPIPKDKKIVSEKIKYHGSISDAEKVKSILQNADVLVCPSHSEGMPNVILEAMASGLAIVATDVGAVSLMVGEKNGWLLPKVDVNLLTQTLKNICNIDKQILQNKQQQSIQLVKEKFLFDKIIERLIIEISTINTINI